ncbi:MAG TPA: hypothetical protein VFK58_04050 [Sphingomicrobium sp.]|nr:hypothetical protein [Sphingomicrobium sp.]
MNRLAMSTAAAALLRAMLGRANVQRDRILLTDYRSVDWQSLTFVGERHEFRFRVPGPGAAEVVAALTDGLEATEFLVPGQIVADVALEPRPVPLQDGAISFGIEALTVEE